MKNIYKTLATSVLTVMLLLTALSCQKSTEKTSSKASTGLIAINEVEQKINEAYIKAWDGYMDDYEGVANFEITDANEKTHDKCFSCKALSLDENGYYGIDVTGLVKDGEVIQIQSTFMCHEDLFLEFGTDAGASFLALTSFPISIFKNDIDTIEEFGTFLTEMECIDNGENGASKYRTVDGNIEYSCISGSGSGFVLHTFTIRYLPAFDGGYFEDDN